MHVCPTPAQTARPQPGSRRDVLVDQDAASPSAHSEVFTQIVLIWPGKWRATTPPPHAGHRTDEKTSNWSFPLANSGAETRRKVQRFCSDSPTPNPLLPSGIVRTGSIRKVLNYSTLAFPYVNYWTARQIVWKQNRYRTVSSHLILHRFYTCNTCILFPLV